MLLLNFTGVMAVDFVQQRCYYVKHCYARLSIIQIYSSRQLFRLSVFFLDFLNVSFGAALSCWGGVNTRLFVRGVSGPCVSSAPRQTGVGKRTLEKNADQSRRVQSSRHHVQTGKRTIKRQYFERR